MRKGLIAGLMAGPIALALALTVATADAKVGEETVEVGGVVAVEEPGKDGTKVIKIVGDKKTYVVKEHPKRPELVERLHGVHGGHVKVKGKVTTTETGHEVVLEEMVTKPADTK